MFPFTVCVHQSIDEREFLWMLRDEEHFVLEFKLSRLGIDELTQNTDLKNA